MALTRVNAGFLRARMEAAAFHATGRRLTVSGPIHLILWPAPGFVAADVALANIAGGSRPVMARASEVQATLDLAALLGQRVIVRSLVLQDADILVERTADGRPNWVFTPPPRPVSVRSPGEVLPASPPAHVKLTISSVDIEGGRLTWHNLPALGDGGFAIGHLAAQQQEAASSFTLFLAGQHATTPFALSLAAAPPQALLAADADHPFALRASLTLGRGDPQDQLGIDGQFADPLHGRGFAGVVHARLRALADLQGLFPHADLPVAEAVRLEARVAEGGAGWTVTQLRAETGRVDAARLLPGLTFASFAATAPNASAPLVVNAAGSLRGQAFAIDGTSVGNLLALTQGSAAAPLDVAASLGAAKASLHGTIDRGADGTVRLDAASTLAMPDPGAAAAAFGGTLDRHVPVVEEGHLAATRDAAGHLTATLATTRLVLGAAPMPASRFELDRQPAGKLRVALALGNDAPWLTWSKNTSKQPPEFTAVLAGHLVPAGLVAALLGQDARAIDGPLDFAGSLHGQAPGGRIDLAQLDGQLAATLVDGTISGAFLAPRAGGDASAGRRRGAGALRRLRRDRLTRRGDARQPFARQPAAHDRR